MKCTIVVTILESILLFPIDRKFQSNAEYVNVLHIQRKQAQIQWLHFICCISSIYKIEPYICTMHSTSSCFCDILNSKYIQITHAVNWLLQSIRST